MYQLTAALDSASKTPLYEQLYRRLAADIRAVRLAAGERLPSKRALCAHLGVSMVTVEAAYGLLSAEGYILARARSGYYVSDFVTLDAPERVAAPQRRASA